MPVPLISRLTEDIINRLKTWIAPPEFAAALEKAQDVREDGTATWLFKVPAFQSWMKQQHTRTVPSTFNESALWIQGEP
jgi:hypothetical protein